VAKPGVASSVTPMARKQRAEVLERLLDAGIVDVSAIARAELVAGRTGQPVEQVLNQLGSLTDEDLVAVYAQVSGCELWEPDRYAPETDIETIGVSVEFLRRNRIIPLAVNRTTLVCAAIRWMTRRSRVWYSRRGVRFAS
jgi:general secretion pathway protein E